MEFNGETTWPDDGRAWLEEHRDLFLSWELRARGDQPPRQVSGAEYDAALQELRDLLVRYDLHGYHCTRLVDAEISYITGHGMQPPNCAVLAERIRPNKL